MHDMHAITISEIKGHEFEGKQEGYMGEFGEGKGREK